VRDVADDPPGGGIERLESAPVVRLEALAAYEQVVGSSGVGAGGL